ncbi:integrator complex subunit 6 homolog [Chrysoperla carnea]|uniref:integrator complex subunit 6 homolog n=1 Tax=Chrysoperla carnea TaxID=189513 RepID=UPI001D06733A|nr:integrator complex subunit 6 homolog [Chrysoperla carnea]
MKIHSHHFVESDCFQRKFGTINENSNYDLQSRMIQHEYRKIYSPVTMMMPSSDAICPRCRHVFPTMTSTQSSNTKKEESPYNTNPFTEYSSLQHHSHQSEDDDDLTPTFTSPSTTAVPTSSLTTSSCVSETDIPPTPPPRLKPVLYANIPPPITSTTPSTNTKPYVTMSNINLQPNGFVTSTNQPNFIPLSSPTNNYQPSIFTSNPLIKQPPPPSLCEGINGLTISNPTNRVYRQLSGGGLVQDSQNNGIRIHEAQPMHQMSGGGLINTRIDDFLHESSTASLSLPSLRNDTKSTKLLISTTEITSPSSTSISISPLSTSSNISILVPTSLNTSLEISPNSINITVPRVTTPTKNNNSIFQAPIRRNTSQRQTRRIRNGIENNQQIFFPTTISPEYLLQLNKLTSPPPQPIVVDDMKCLSQTVNRLKESGWFHEGLSWNDSETLLTGTANGTFVVRESSNPNFLFAITVQTKQEPTSVRIQYDNGHFRLDCVSHVTPIVPQFDCVVDLIEYYVTKHNSTTSKLNSNLINNNNINNKNNNNNNNFLGNQVFVDENGQINSIVSLNKPLRSTVPSLTHCARLAINKQLRSCQTYSKYELANILDNLELPKSLKIYLFRNGSDYTIEISTV